MYQTILITLETTPTDRCIIEHVKKLAATMKSRVVLLHVATGVPAMWHRDNAAGKEIDEDRAYLNAVKGEFESEDIPARTELAFGDPYSEIVKWVRGNDCDLIAMSTHGHRGVADILLGAVASRVQHAVSVPVLMLRAK